MVRVVVDDADAARPRRAARSAGRSAEAGERAGRPLGLRSPAQSSAASAAAALRALWLREPSAAAGPRARAARGEARRRRPRARRRARASPPPARRRSAQRRGAGRSSSPSPEHEQPVGRQPRGPAREQRLDVGQRGEVVVVVEVDVEHDRAAPGAGGQRAVRLVALGHDQTAAARAGVRAELRHVAADQEGRVVARARRST